MFLEDRSIDDSSSNGMGDQKYLKLHIHMQFVLYFLYTREIIVHS
jgi:hypothetical protein